MLWVVIFIVISIDIIWVLSACKVSSYWDRIEEQENKFFDDVSYKDMSDEDAFTSEDKSEVESSLSR